MGSVTKGSGIAVSALVAATASVLLLVPGHTRAGYWRGTGTSRGVMVVSAAAASPSGTAGPSGRRPAAAPPHDRPAAADRPAVPRPACRATGAHGGRAGPGVTVPGKRGGRTATAGRGSCRAPRMPPDQESRGRLPRYH